MIKNKIFKNTLIFSCFFLFLLFSQLIFQGKNLDNYWNFDNSMQISNGLLPYRDISIITTPLFHFIVSVFLSIFGKNIVAFAAICSIFKIAHAVLIVKIIELLMNKKDKVNNFLMYTILIFLFYVSYYEYNLLAVFFISCITYVELKFKESKNKNIIIGFLAALSFLTKHSIGAFALLFTFIKPLLFKKDNKKNILYRSLGMFIPLFIFLLYLLFTDTLNDFLSYCLFGLQEFKNEISVFESISISLERYIPFFFIFLLFITIYVTIKELYKAFKDKKYKDNRKVVLFYYLVSIACMYPIRDLHHLMPVVITIFPLCSLYSFKRIKNKPLYIKKNIMCVIVFGLIISSLVPLNMYIKIYHGDNPYLVVLKDDYYALNGMIVQRNNKSFIDNIKSFEEKMAKNGIETIILDSESVVIHLSNGKYYKDYDLFMRGNFGQYGEQKMIDDIKSRKNTVYLLNKEKYLEENKRYTQYPDKVINYVMNNMKEDDEIYPYSVYKKWLKIYFKNMYNMIKFL